MRTRPATEPACIFRMTCPRWTLIVFTLMPISSAIRWLVCPPRTTHHSISRSRGVRSASQALNEVAHVFRPGVLAAEGECASNAPEEASRATGFCKKSNAPAFRALTLARMLA